MKVKREALGRASKVKATMLQAHLEWARKHVGDLERLTALLDQECAGLLGRMLSTDWVLLRCLINVDRAIAAAAGRPSERVFQDLGRHSAAVNLSGVYRAFISSEPHRFFDQMSVLHGQFQNFGRSRYEKAGESAGRIILEGYTEYSPVYCASAKGYFEEALRMMHAPGPIAVSETACQCAGDAQCLFEMTW